MGMQRGAAAAGGGRVTTITWEEYTALCRDRDNLRLLETVWEILTGESLASQLAEVGRKGSPKSFLAWCAARGGKN